MFLVKLLFILCFSQNGKSCFASTLHLPFRNCTKSYFVLIVFQNVSCPRGNVVPFFIFLLPYLRVMLSKKKRIQRYNMKEVIKRNQKPRDFFLNCFPLLAVQANVWLTFVYKPTEVIRSWKRTNDLAVHAYSITAFIGGFYPTVYSTTPIGSLYMSVIIVRVIINSSINKLHSLTYHN